MERSYIGDLVRKATCGGNASKLGDFLASALAETNEFQHGLLMKDSFLLACQYGHIEVVKLLFKIAKPKRIKLVNCTDQNGQTGLHRACSNGHCQLVKYLIDHRSSTHVEDNLGWTPLALALCGFMIEVRHLGSSYGPPSVQMPYHNIVVTLLSEGAVIRRSDIAADVMSFFADLSLIFPRLVMRSLNRNNFALEILQSSLTPRLRQDASFRVQSLKQFPTKYSPGKLGGVMRLSALCRLTVLTQLPRGYKSRGSLIDTLFPTTTEQRKRHRQTICYLKFLPRY